MRLGPIIAVVFFLVVNALASALSPAATPKYGVFEAELSSDRKYANPSADVELSVEFTSPSGDRTKVDAFWDGDDFWRFRFSPTRTGKWTWRSKCSDKSNSGLHDRIGDFICN